MSEISHLIKQIEDGDPTASEELLPLVYDELRRLAAAKLRNERPGQTLQPTALVHEAYLKLVGDQNGCNWGGRRHFFAAAAETMRRILVDAAWRRRSVKHGGHVVRKQVSDSQLIDDRLDETESNNLIALDQALVELAIEDPNLAELVKLRYFTGLTVKESATALNISPRTADFMWAYARAWLRRNIENQ